MTTNRPDAIDERIDLAYRRVGASGTQEADATDVVLVAIDRGFDRLGERIENGQGLIVESNDRNAASIEKLAAAVVALPLGMERANRIQADLFKAQKTAAPDAERPDAPEEPAPRRGLRKLKKREELGISVMTTTGAFAVLQFVMDHWGFWR